MNTYKIRSRKNPLDMTAPEKFYATVVSTGEVDMEQLAELISYQSTLTPPDIYAVLLALEHNVIGQLNEGKIVRMGNLGSFRISFSSEGLKHAEEVTADAITRRRILYRPGKKLRKLLDDLSFRKSG